MQDCSFFVNVIPPQQLTGSLNGRLPLIGNPVQLIACEDLLTNGHHCGETLATDSKLVPLVATYGVFVRSVAVFHTRAHSTDTTWVSVIGDTDISNLDKSKCRGPHPTNNCETLPAGDFQDGDHALKFPFPQVGDFALGADSDSSFRFAFAVWNYGFELVPSWFDLSDALINAAVPVFSTISPSEEIDLTPALNDHPWQGCDGPTAGTAFRMTGAQLEQLTRATGNFSQTIGRYVVKSQVGCGASSQYAVTFAISRTRWFAP